MHKQALILSIALFVPATGHASSVGKRPLHATGLTRNMRGDVLVQRMISALDRQSRIEVRGQLDGPGSQSVKYLVRYQAAGREYVLETGGMWNQVQIGHRRLEGLQAIAVGKTMYSSTDGTHWVRSARLVPPAARDTISINPALVPCCVQGKTATSQVINTGMESSPFGRVYALNFHTTSINASIVGTVLIDMRTFLPRKYTEYCHSMGLRGTFVLTYGGAFRIQTPVR